MPSLKLVLVLVNILFHLVCATNLCAPPPGYIRSDITTQDSFFKLHNVPGGETKYKDARTICSEEGGTRANHQHPNDPSEIWTLN